MHNIAMVIGYVIENDDTTEMLWKNTIALLGRLCTFMKMTRRRRWYLAQLNFSYML